MKTLSPTQARSNLSSVLKRAANGEDIGILHGDKIIALRPVTVHSDDYALQEYGFTEKNVTQSVRRWTNQTAPDRTLDPLKRYTRDWDADVEDGSCPPVSA